MKITPKTSRRLAKSRSMLPDDKKEKDKILNARKGIKSLAAQLYQK
jgi:hypothetical protein